MPPADDEGAITRFMGYKEAVQPKHVVWITAVLALFALRYITGIVGFSLAGIAASCLLIAANTRFLVEFCGRNLVFGIGLAVCVLFAVWNGPQYDWRPLYYVIVGACMAVTAATLAEDDGAALLASKVLYTGFVAVLLVMAPFKGVYPEAFNHYFPNSSRNGISAALIFLQIFYSAAFFIQTRKAPLISVVVTFAICVILFGRSGILLSSGLVAVTVIQNLRAEPIKSSLSGGMVAIVLIIVVFFPMVPMGEDVLPAPVAAAIPEGSNGLGERVNDPALSEFRLGLYSIRSNMIIEYAQRLNPVTAITGVPLETVPWIAEYHGNAHNSFIRGHAYFGAAYILLGSWVFISALARALKRQEFFLLALMALFAGRAFFDSVALFDVFDAGFFYCYFLLMRPQARQAEPQTQPQ